MSEMIKLNLGCGGRPLPGYVNIDRDDLEAMKKRYPNQTFDDELKIFQYDIFNLPYEDSSVDEIRADSFIEHLGFKEEKKLFLEVRRVLKKEGIFTWNVPDFEATVKTWLAAEDDWQDFFRDDEEAIKSCHWFGTYTYEPKNRWGYLTAMLFGPQNGEGQYHKNAYTEGKIKAMMAKLGFEIKDLSRFRWKGDRDLMLQVVAKKVNENPEIS